MLHVDIAVAKVAKYAVHESGDTVEVVERPNGGLSVVMADGQRSGRSAKAISNLAVRKAISLLAEGVRDGAVMRAAHDYLRTQRSGQVSAELTILSVDLETRTLVVSRNSQCPVFLVDPGSDSALSPVDELTWQSLDEPATTVGIYNRARPVITERPLEAGQVVVAFTDGVLHAGERRPHPLDIRQLLTRLPECRAGGAQTLADAILDAAVAADAGRPGDDTTVVVIKVHAADESDAPTVRRMTVSFPVPTV